MDRLAPGVSFENVRAPLERLARLGDYYAFSLREIDLLELRGKKNAIRVFELLGLPGQIPEAILNGYRIYEEGLAAFRRKDWDGVFRLKRFDD